jgi:hypothetical protein
MESPDLREYRKYFMPKQWEKWMRKLMSDVYGNAKAMGQEHNIFVMRKKYVHPDEISIINLTAILIRSFARLRALFASLADQLDVRDEKSLIFANNPWES